MARLVFGLMQSLDGYVDHRALGPPGPELSAHFTDHMRRLAGCIQGRRTYEIMQYWDEDQPDWGGEEHAFAAIWRAKPKWVVSRSLSSVGLNATLMAGDVEASVRRLKAERDGEIDVAGPDLARSLGEAGLIDEYRLYLRPVVLGGGTPYFAGLRPRLRLLASDVLGEGTVRLTYAPA